MKLPYSIQGALFAPTLVLLIFILKVTCPAPTGGGCFADPFISSVFFPLPAIYRLFGQRVFITLHEPLIILVYWLLVGLFAGLVVDLIKKENKNTLV